ncbi:MAG: glycosyltransferase [Burkholderiales bacterium]
MALYPYVLYPLVLRVLPERPIQRKLGISEDGSNFALLFCAYNEMRSIESKLENVRELLAEYPRLAVHVYDDMSSDGTAAILAESQLPLNLVLSQSRSGKAHGMQLLAQEADRDFLIFTDANVLVQPGSLDTLSASYVDPLVGGVCGTLRYVAVSDSQSTSDATGAYWKLEERVKTYESRSGNVLGADGSIFSIRSDLYPKFPDTVLDDLTVSMSAIFAGKRLIKDDGLVGTEEILGDQGKDLRRRIRISMRAFHTHLWLRPQLKNMTLGDRWRYWSHRYVRWFGGAALLIAFASAMTALFLTSPWLALGAALAIAAAGLLTFRMDLGFPSSLTHIAVSMLLTSYGVFKSIRGKTRATWEPPR